MHSFRLRYIVLGLLIYIQSAFCRTCGSDFDDVGSRAVAAAVVFEGSVKKLTTPQTGTGNYNATFSVRKLLKGTLPLKPGSTKKIKDISVGVFGPEDNEGCVSEVNTGNKYIVFLASPSNVSPVPSYEVSSFPVKPSKKITRELRKYICDPQESCISKPTGSVKPKRAKRKEGDNIKLQCKVKGKPLPQVSWLKDGVPVQPSRRLQVKAGKKGSTLRLKKLEIEDTGVYVCLARNTAGETSLTASINVKEGVRDAATTTTTTTTVAVTSTSRPPPNAVECEHQDYCLNGGTCYRLEPAALGDQFCKCQTGYDGRRCESLADFELLEKLESRQAHQMDRAFTITGLVVGALVVLSLCIAAYVMARRRRSQFRKKRAEKKRLRDQMSNGNYRPASDCPATQMELQPMVSCSQKATQTDRFLLQSIIAEMSVPQSQSSHSSLPHHSSNGSAPRRSSRGSQGRSSQGRNSQGRNSHGSLPRQNTAPSSVPATDSASSSRSRLRGVSSTPDVERDRRQHSGNIAVVNAVVESDPEHARSSPSQSSITESAHGDGGVHRAKRNNSLEADDKSDYDNQASDMEVNMESEVDLQGLEVSGDEVEHIRYVRHPDTSSDSSDTADTSSIEDSPEKEIFAKMIAGNPTVKAPIANNSRWGNNSGHWDGAYNPYDDSDIIANRFLINDNHPARGVEKPSRRKPADPREKHLHERLLEPIDPDPDATVV